jgi:tyrosyl-tRNA synthetase
MTVTYKSDFLNVLAERGFVHQMTDAAALDAALCKGQVTGYCGFDATANSLHVGNLVAVTMLRWFQKTGHRPIALLGGGTSKVGDPSGRDETRKLLTDEDLAQNKAGILKNFQQFIDFENDRAVLVDNNDWLGQLNYIDFLRDVGVHYSVNRMLAMDSVKLRLEREQNLSFIEFNYMLMQGYDFVVLREKYGCTLQISGADQWGNIISGVELGRRMKGMELFGLTAPLITKADGSKMGKSVSGAMWLSADRLSAYDYYQFWRNTADADVEKMLSLFTELPMDEVRRLGALAGAEINEAKKVLAFEATKLCHGEAAAQHAADTAQQTFEQGGLGEGLPELIIFDDQFSVGKSVVDLLVESKLAESKGEAKRLINGGGVKINDVVVKDENHKINKTDLGLHAVIKLSVGKKRNVQIKVMAGKSSIKSGL